MNGSQRRYRAREGARLLDMVHICVRACMNCDGCRGQRGVARCVTYEAPQVMRVYFGSLFLQYLHSALHRVGVEVQSCYVLRRFGQRRTAYTTVVP